MYRVGLSGERWRLITDGTTAYLSGSDLRFYESIIDAEIRLDPIHCELFCQQQSLKLLSSIDAAEASARNGLKGGIKGALAGSLFLLANPVAGIFFVILGFVLGRWLSTDDTYREERLSEVFFQARRKYETQEIRRHEAEERLLEEQHKAIQLAQSRWHRYHLLQDFGSVDSLSGTEFEGVIEKIFTNRGFRVELTPASGDFGVDLVATKGSDRIAIQAKRLSGSVGVSAVQEVASGLRYYRATKAIVITNAEFTEAAKKLARAVDVSLVSRRELAKMWEKYLPQTTVPPFDFERYKRLKPEIDRLLRRVEKQ